MKGTTSAADLDLLTANAAKDWWTLECDECDSGRRAYSFGTGTGTLTYETGVTGKGCPLDNTYHPASCNLMNLNSGNYICTCTGKVRAVFTITSSQTYSQGCIETANSLTDCSVYTFADPLTGVKCNTCSTGKTYAEI
jgi:hypothetical protein